MSKHAAAAPADQQAGNPTPGSLRGTHRATAPANTEADEDRAELEDFYPKPAAAHVSTTGDLHLQPITRGRTMRGRRG